MLSKVIWGFATLTAILPRVAGYSFTFANSPRQCQNVTINITGNDGSPPYKALLIPIGSSPISKEVRRITDINFPDNSNSVTFQMKYPTNSGFIIVVSDANTFGSGGTSGTVYVQANDDTSCFDPNSQVSPSFVFSIVPAGQLIQCQNTRIWWDPSVQTETPTFHAVIPAGNSIQIPQSQLSTVSNQGRGFNWTVNVKAGENVLLVAGDSKGTGSGGSAPLIVQQVNGAAPEVTSCLNSSSPSRTPGNAAGGTYPTQTGVDPSGSGTASATPSGLPADKVNAGAIAGGVVGGVIALVLIAILVIFCLKRSKKNSRRNAGAVDIEDDEGPSSRNPHDLPAFYQPQPFMVPDPSSPSRQSMSEINRSSLSDSTSAPPGVRAETPEGLRLGTNNSVASQPLASRKSPLGPTVLRPVNVFQHDDAGHQDEAESDTIELPPAYNNIKQPKASGSGQPADETS